MKITRKNYEQFFLDYFEGNLPDNRVGELMRFLDENPDLRDEFDVFELIRVDGDDGVHFPGKESLKKSVPVDVSAGSDHTGSVQEYSGPGSECISPDNYEEYFAAYVEGDLEKEERAEVEAFAASDPHYGRELELMRQTRLVPDPAIRFPRKGSLKRHHIGLTARRVLHYASAAAAVFLLGVVAYTLFPLQQPVHVAYEWPVEEEVAPPGAVAEVPAPQQDEDTPLLRQETGETGFQDPGTQSLQAEFRPQEEEIAPSRATALPAELFRPGTAPAPAFADERQVETVASRPMMASRIEPRQVASYAGAGDVISGVEELSDVGGDVPQRLIARAELTPRDEYIWLAYRAPGYLVIDDTDDFPAQEGGLPRLAASRLQETTGVDTRRMEEVLTESSSGLAEFADRSVSEISRFLSGLVTVNEKRDDGRRVQLAIGNAIEVSRTTAPEE